jgi:heme exporter protein C
MGSGRKVVNVVYWGVAAASSALAAAMLVFYTPTEATMGPIQKVFYLHLPVAINTLLACAAVFVCSIGFLRQRRLWWDDLASAAAAVAVLMGSVTLLTGVIWGRSAWGVWWTWSPRLTFTLILWLLYVVYMIVRPAVESRERRAVVSAVYGVVAFLDVPLVYLTAKLLPDIHPASIELVASMKLTLAAWFVPVTLISVGLVVGRYRLNRRLAPSAESPPHTQESAPRREPQLESRIT